MKIKLIILLLALGVSVGCKKESGQNEKEILEVIHQDRAEATVKSYCESIHKYKPVSFGKLNENTIEHTFKAVGKNVGESNYDKEYTATYVFILNDDLSKVIDLKEK